MFSIFRVKCLRGQGYPQTIFDGDSTIPGIQDYAMWNMNSLLCLLATMQLLATTHAKKNVGTYCSSKDSECVEPSLGQ